MTQRQRRHINDILRDSYDEAALDAKGEAFSIVLHMSDIHHLTSQNEHYLRSGKASADYQKLFGIIAARAEFSIDSVDNDYIIGIHRDGKPSSRAWRPPAPKEPLE